MWKKNYLKFIDSTQTEAMNRIKANVVKSPEYFYSFNQFKGFGRRGKKWIKADKSLAISFVFDTNIKSEVLPLIPVYASILVAKGIEKFADLNRLSLGLKWPNDIFKANKKIGGILAQTISHDKKVWVVLGVGVNLLWNPSKKNEHSFGSIFDNDYNSIRNENLVNNIASYMREILKPINGSFIKEEFNRRDIYLHKKVKIDQAHSQIYGRNLGLTSNGQIHIRDNKGKDRIS